MLIINKLKINGNLGNVQSFHSFVPPDETYLETKQRIIKVTEELVFRYGVKSVSMDDIAKELGMSKKTIYQFFKDKDEIVHVLFHEKLKEDHKKFHGILSGSSNVIEEMINLMRNLGEMFRKVNPSTFYDLQKYYPKTWKLFLDFKEDFIFKTMEEALLRGIKQGMIRPDINVKVLVRLRMEQIDMMLNPRVFPPEKFSIADVQLSILEHFLYGVCTLKGHRLINEYEQIIEEE